MEPKLKLVKANRYFSELAESIANASSHVYIQAMVIEFSPEMENVITALRQAARRGVTIVIHIDYYSQMYTLDHINYMPFLSFKRKQYIESFRKANRKIIDSLTEAGVTFRFTNKPTSFLGKIFPVFGRNHTKITVVDSSAYIGGMNFSIEYAERADFMMKTIDPLLVEMLTHQFFQVNELVQQNDYSLSIDEFSTLLVDVGNQGKSVIYTTALNTIQNASHELFFISQLLPDFEILSAISRSVRKGIKASLITSSSSRGGKKVGKDPKGVHKTFTKRIEFILYSFRSRYLPKPRYYSAGNGRVHAKLLIIDPNSDKKCALFGSHNYSKFGVLFGTNEIAIKTSDPLIIEQLFAWYKDIEQNQSQTLRDMQEE